MKQRIALFLALTLCFYVWPFMGAAGFSGVLFRDVEDSHWALDRIFEASEAKLIPGYSDGTFHPNQKVSHLEALTALYRTVKYSGKMKPFSPMSALSIFQTQFQNAGIPAYLAPYGSDVYTALVYALEIGLISASDISTLVTNGLPELATKHDLVYYTGKILNHLQNTIMVPRIQSLNYRDATLISKELMPYLMVVVDAGVIGPTGDSNGYFNPDKTIGRDVLSVFITGLSDALEKLPSGNLIDVTLVDSVPVKPVEVDPGNASAALELASHTDLTAEMIADLKAMPVLAGMFEALSNPLGLGENTYRVLTLMTENGVRHYLRVYKTAIVQIDGFDRALDQLSLGDHLVVAYTGYDAKRIEAHSETYEVLAVLLAPSTFNVGDLVMLKLPNGTVLNQILTSSVEVTTLKERTVRTGDFLKVRFRYGDVIRIEATSLISQDRGLLRELTISDLRSSLTLQNADGVRQRYPVASGVEVFMVDAADWADDMTIEYPVTLTQEASLPESNSLLSLKNGLIENEDFVAPRTFIEPSPMGLYALRLDQMIIVAMDSLGIYQILVKMV